MSSTNFNNILLIPMDMGTHTECLGITSDFYSVNQSLKQFFFTAELVSIDLEDQEGDFIVTKEALESALEGKSPQAIVIRTLPMTRINYSNIPIRTSFLAERAALFLRESGIQHLLIDLPSVDKEKDEGKLLAHKAFGM
jgi:kynurenine formamidase